MSPPSLTAALDLCSAVALIPAISSPDSQDCFDVPCTETATVNREPVGASGYHDRLFLQSHCSEVGGRILDDRTRASGNLPASGNPESISAPVRRQHKKIVALFQYSLCPHLKIAEARRIAGKRGIKNSDRNFKKNGRAAIRATRRHKASPPCGR